MAESHRKEGFDHVFELVGGHGRFQWYLLAIISLQLIITTWHHVGYVFLGAVPEHWCLIEDLKGTNWTTEEIKQISIPRIPDTSNSEVMKWDNCHHYYLNYGSLVATSVTFEEAYAKINFTNLETRKCVKWSYDQSTYTSTVATDFDLVCQSRPLVATIQATYMVGSFVGTLLFGALSDKILGRRVVVLISCGMFVVFGLAASFAKTYTLFVIFRFIIAMGVSGSMQNCYVLIMEHADLKYRAHIGIIEQIPFAIGYMILPLYAYFIRSWSNLQLAFGISSLVLFSYLWILPASPRWLAANGKDERALKCLRKIAKVNGMPEPEREELIALIRSCQEKDPSEEEEDDSVENAKPKSVPEFIKIKFILLTENFRNLLRSGEMRRRSLVFWFLFLTVTMVYYGFVFSANLTSDPFLLVFLGGLMEVPAYTVIVPFVSKFGRRPTTSATFFITGVASLAISITPLKFQIVRIIFSMGGKMFISAAFAIIYLLGAELYPTAMRTTGLAVGVLMGRVGAISAPYIVDLMSSVYSDLPCIIFGIFAVFGGIVSLLLPETKHMVMFDQVHELEQAAADEKAKPKRDWKDTI